MHTDTNPAVKRGLRSVVSGLQSQMDDVLKKKQVELKRRNQATARAEAESRRNEEIRNQKHDSNLNLAVAGMRSIMAFGQRSEIQQIIAMKKKAPELFWWPDKFLTDEEGSFAFYHAFGGTTDIEATEVYIALLEKDMLFYTSSYACLQAWAHIKYGAEEAEIRKFLLEYGVLRNDADPLIQWWLTEEKYKSLFLEQEANFDWSALLGRVLIECEKPRRFKEYCLRALRPLQTS